LADETPDTTADDTAPDAAAGDETPEPEPEPAPALDPRVEELLERVQAALGDAVVAAAANHGDVVVRVHPEAWRRAAEVARAELDCDYLSFVSGLDWEPAPKEGGDDAGGDTSSPVQPMEMTFGVGGSDGRFQLLAHVESTTRHWGVSFKTDLDESRPVAESWVPVYPGADWHERECWEMFGFEFDGHPHLRHLYLPTGFEGHPLRKDFPLLARVVKPWPGLVDVEPMPGDAADTADADAAAGDGDGEEAG
jgi:NADH-quinone oxidoreductase subunit C